MAYGEDEELDAVVQGWKEERPGRLSASSPTTCAISLGEARLADQGQAMAIELPPQGLGQ